MEEILDWVLVEGDLLSTFVHLFILCLSFDCLLSFANALKVLKGSVS